MRVRCGGCLRQRILFDRAYWFRLRSAALGEVLFGQRPRGRAQRSTQQRKRDVGARIAVFEPGNAVFAAETLSSRVCQGVGSNLLSREWVPGTTRTTLVRRLRVDLPALLLAVSTQLAACAPKRWDLSHMDGGLVLAQLTSGRKDSWVRRHSGIACGRDDAPISHRVRLLDASDPWNCVVWAGYGFGDGATRIDAAGNSRVGTDAVRHPGTAVRCLRWRHRFAARRGRDGSGR